MTKFDRKVRRVRARASETELKMAAADLKDCQHADLREAMLNLVKEGKIVDSGQRRKGHIVWVAAENAKKH